MKHTRVRETESESEGMSAISGEDLEATNSPTLRILWVGGDSDRFIVDF